MKMKITAIWHPSVGYRMGDAVSYRMKAKIIVIDKKLKFNKRAQTAVAKASQNLDKINCTVHNRLSKITT